MACAREDEGWGQPRSAVRVPWPTCRGGRTSRTSAPSQQNGGRAERVPRLGTQSTVVDSDDDRPLLRAVSPRLNAVHPFCQDDGQPWGPEPPSRRIVLVPQLSDTPQSFHYRQISSQASDCAQVAFGVPSLTEAEQGNQHRSEVTLSVFVGEAHPFTVDVDVASTAECCAHHGPQPFRRVGTGRDPTAGA